jgi:hypothetical protein
MCLHPAEQRMRAQGTASDEGRHTNVDYTNVQYTNVQLYCLRLIARIATYTLEERVPTTDAPRRAP